MSQGISYKLIFYLVVLSWMKYLKNSGFSVIPCQYVKNNSMSVRFIKITNLTNKTKAITDMELRSFYCWHGIISGLYKFNYSCMLSYIKKISKHFETIKMFFYSYVKFFQFSEKVFFSHKSSLYEVCTFTCYLNFLPQQEFLFKSRDSWKTNPNADMDRL